MALHDWIKNEWQDESEDKEERWSTEFGELNAFQLAQGMIPPHGDPDKPRPDIRAIEKASAETIAREINDPYWTQPQSATTMPEPPSDTDIFVRASERYLTPKDTRDWKEAIRNEEAIRAEARAEFEQPEFPKYDPSPVTEEQREEYELEAPAGEDEWEFDQDDSPYQTEFEDDAA
jgi:hypothetical protein